MICPKRHTTKGVTQKVAPTHSPPAAPDVTKKGRKPPKICKDIPWSPTKVVRRKLAPPPDTTVYLMHLKEMSPPSPLLPAASKLVTGACSAAAAASTNLYCQLYSAKDNNHKGEEFYSADDKGNNNNQDYVDIHKHINNNNYNDYDDILDMDIDSKEELRSSFPKNQNSSKLQFKGGDLRPDVSGLSEKEAEEVIDTWKVKRKAFTDKVNQTAVKADIEMRKFEFDTREEALGDHSTQLCAMSVVNASRLSAGHLF